MRSYRETFQRMVKNLETQPAGKQKEVLSAAIDSFAETCDDWQIWSAYASGHRDLTESRRIFESALARFSGNALLVDSYANFLADRMHEYFLAEKYYNKALELDPYCAMALTDYAVFLADTKHRNEKSEQLLRKAEEIQEQKGDVFLEIEQVIRQHKYVQNAIVVSKQNRSANDSFYAFVLPKDDARSCLQESDILEFCQLRLSENKQPAHVIVGDIPSTQTGKIYRHYLKEIVKKLP